MKQNYVRTHHCNALTKEDIDTHVTLSGWVHRRRDHGGLIFIDLRDRFGLTQIVFSPEVDATLHEKANALRSEWVISVTGRVIPRAEGMVNPNLDTGEIEIEAQTLSILSQAKTPPFSVCDETINVHEELRLKYRYLDLRRGPLAAHLRLRHKAMLAARNYFDTEGFVEIQTPILAKSTPEGARDYLVPSRVTPGAFYALPQSPQVFKQLLMISGMDRYFQIAPCFRDEDLRADRQPEFTQIDFEMSFGTPETLFPIVERMIATICAACGRPQPAMPFPRMTYREAIERYGTDKPDLRFGMPLHTLSDLASESTFSVFLDQIKAGGIVKGLCVKGGATFSRKMIDELTTFVGHFGLHGLAWIKWQEEGPTSSIVKFFEPGLLEKFAERMNVETGDLVLMAASTEPVVNQALDHLRRHLARQLNLIDESAFALTWVTDFPLFQLDVDSGRLACEHNPFTSPYPDDIPLLDSQPLKARSSAYDLVLNGYEIVSGAQRIYDSAVQQQIFSLLELSEEDVKKRFGFFLEALQYGTPPHLGAALGLDRLIMILVGTDNIRDVIAFPKTQRAGDLMMDAPSPVLKEQLTELKLHIHDQEAP